VGISSSFLSLLEQGRTDIAIGRLLHLAWFYDVELTDPLGDEPKHEAAPAHRTERDARLAERARVSRDRPGRATARRRRGRDIDKVGCRVRYRDLREAGPGEVLRQLPQFGSRPSASACADSSGGSGHRC
jgi:hypothetical protein